MMAAVLAWVRGLFSATLCEGVPCGALRLTPHLDGYEASILADTGWPGACVGRDALQQVPTSRLYAFVKPKIRASNMLSLSARYIGLPEGL
jgi:hypothetical protein|tara:strand:- start:982 stop:1254 length:273 start_codon:yes stop_codon:yes gene_type:complete